MTPRDNSQPDIGKSIDRAALYPTHDLKLVLVRHGQQIPVTERTPENYTNPPLTALGRRQADAVAEHLSGEQVDAVYTSTMERAQQTGQAIAQRHGLETAELHDLREIEVMRHLPTGSTPADAIDPLTWGGAAATFAQTGRWESFPLAEGSAEFRLRVRRGVEAILARHDEGQVVVACHAGVINAYVAEILDVSRDFFFRAAHCSVTRVNVSGDRRAVWNLNEHHHLAGDLLSA